MTAQQLKNSILQMAVQGKLVPQNPADEPASTLLKKIKAEKDALIKSGKIKRDKHESIIIRDEDGRYIEKKDGKTTDISDEIPFDIPNTWEWVRLEKIITLISGQDFEPSGYNDTGKGIPYITGASNMVDGNLIVNRWTQTPSSVALSGDLLVTCKGAGVGKMVCMDIPQAHIARQIMAVRPICGLLREYVGTVLSSRISQIRGQMNGLIPGISRDVMLGLLFPLPPLAEQKRIVAKIEELLPHLAEYDHAETEVRKLNEEFPDMLKKSILQSAIQGKLVAQDPTDEPASELLKRIKAEKNALIKSGKLKRDKHESVIARDEDGHYIEKKDGRTTDITDEIPFDIPDSWEWVRLSSICDYGTCQSVEANKISESAWLLELEDIEKDSGKLLQRVLKKDRPSVSTKHMFKAGYVLYSKLRTYLNKVLVADMDGFCTSEIIPLDFGNSIFPEYARTVLMSNMFLTYTAQCCYGVKMPRLGTNDGRKALFPLPPLPEQKRIVKRLEIIFLAMEGGKGMFEN